MNPLSSASASASFALARVTPNAWHAFGGIWRLTVRRFFVPTRWLIVVGLLGALAVLTLGGLQPAGHAQQTAHYLDGFASVYVALLVPILAFISAAGLIRDDLKPGSVDYVFTRPLSRPLFTVFRYLAHMACTQVDLLLAFAVMAGIGFAAGVPGFAQVLPLLLLGQVLLVAAFSAFGFLGGVLTSRYIVVGLVYAMIVEVGVGRIPTQLNRLSMTQQVLAMLRPALADAGVQAGDMAALNTEATVLSTVGIVLAFTVVTLAAAATLLGLRETAGDAAAREA